MRLRVILEGITCVMFRRHPFILWRLPHCLPVLAASLAVIRFVPNTMPETHE